MTLQVVYIYYLLLIEFEVRKLYVMDQVCSNPI